MINSATAMPISRIRAIRPAPQACVSVHCSRPMLCAPPRRIRATGERMQSITPTATRREFPSLISRKRFASSIPMVRTVLSTSSAVCSGSSFSIRSFSR